MEKQVSTRRLGGSCETEVLTSLASLCWRWSVGDSSYLALIHRCVSKTNIGPGRRFSVGGLVVDLW